ncbi:hypothetical protein U6L62_12245, partial [Cutibacterium acnes]
ARLRPPRAGRLVAQRLAANRGPDRAGSHHGLRGIQVERFVGWVERSDTHQMSPRGDDGYRCTPPILRTITVILRSAQRVSKGDGPAPSASAWKYPGRASFEARPAAQLRRKARTSG